MTVINAMKFNDKSGAIVADEKSSTQVRSYDIAQKINVLSKTDKLITLVGGTGSASILYQMGRDLENNFEGIGSNYEAAKRVSDVMTDNKCDILNNYIKNQTGISADEFQIGRKQMPDGSLMPIDHFIVEKYQKIMNGQDDIAQLLNNQFIILTKDFDICIHWT